MIVYTLGARSSPIDELDCHFECCVAVTHPVVFLETEEVEKDFLKIGYRRLSDADLGDRRRFDQGDVDVGKGFFQVRSRHPAGCAAAKNENTPDESGVTAVR